MAGMETKLGAVINHPGVFDGFSGNYSGAGFSHMTFKCHGFNRKDFESWAANMRKAGSLLDLARYRKIEKPSEKVARRLFFAGDGGPVRVGSQALHRAGVKCG